MFMYHPGMEGNDDWVRDGLDDWIKSRGFNIVLFDEVTDPQCRKRCNGLIAIARKKGMGTFTSNMRRRFVVSYNVKFEGGKNFKDSDPTPPNMTLVDIADYLPQSVINKMTRKNGTRFHFEHVTNVALSTQEIIQKDVVGLTLYARACGLAKKDLLHKINIGVATGYNMEFSNTDATLLNGSSDDDSGGDEAAKVATLS